MREAQFDFRYLTTLFGRDDYSMLSVPTKTKERAAWLREWWPWKKETKKWKSTRTKSLMVAVNLTERGGEPVTLWVSNSQQAQMLLSSWVNARKKRRGVYKDYTLRCVCGGRFVTGDETPGSGLCEACGKKPRFRVYKGPWNPPGGIIEVKPVGKTAARPEETKAPKKETKKPMQETKKPKRETKPPKRETWGSLL